MLTIQGDFPLIKRMNCIISVDEELVLVAECYALQFGHVDAAMKIKEWFATFVSHGPIEKYYFISRSLYKYSKKQIDTLVINMVDSDTLLTQLFDVNEEEDISLKHTIYSLQHIKNIDIT